MSEGRATERAGNPIEQPGGPFHPTFLYELVWNLGVALLVWLVDRKWKLGRGRAFALYVMAYTTGRFWIEAMRTDEAHVILGMRVNGWVSILVFLGALAYFLRVRGPQEHVRVDGAGKLQLVTAEGEPIPWRMAGGGAGGRADGGDTGRADGGDAGRADGGDAGPPGGGEQRAGGTPAVPVGSPGEDVTDDPAVPEPK